MGFPSLNEKRVLFQRLGNYWYVFVDIDGSDRDVFYTRLPDNLDPKVDEYEIYQVLEEEMKLKKAS